LKNSNLFVVNKYWLSFFLIKVFYLFFGVLVYSKMTTLGDTSRWMSGTIKLPDLIDVLTFSTAMLDFLGGLSSYLFGTLLGNFPFMLLAFYGIYYSVSKLILTNKQLIFILALLSFPSFGVWSSVAGKEAVGVFYMGVILGYIIDLINRKRFGLKLIEIFSIYLLLIFKPQFSIAIFSLILYIVLANKLNLKSSGKVLLLIIQFAFGGVGLWVFKDAINEISFTIPAHFSLDAGSTRENTMWLNDYDIFLNAPYGMFIGFFGPTFSEVMNKPIQGIAFLESFVLVCLFFYMLAKHLMQSLLTSKINIYITALLFIGVFWILFAHYPFGALNAGSALRYRTNFYAFLIVFIFCLYQRAGYKRSIASLNY